MTASGFEAGARSLDPLAPSGLRAHLLTCKQNSNFLKRFNLICPVQSHLQKYFRSRLTQITSISAAVSSHRGAYRDRHGRGAGCGGREQRGLTNGADADGEVVWS